MTLRHQQHDSTTITASCPACGDVTLHPLDVDLDLRGEPVYSFRCPTCHDLVQRDAPEHVVVALVTAGVPAQTRAMWATWEREVRSG